ncbi:ethanolaminephosphotransferase 1-like [Ctenocephalides felis]|uniref:ethanolaminephosphotransferase 1-like n=1 Tax=Ctenocephalides felis TaxID=7515 RepID=UPI000E6E5200|nr:ethanolaminephosphotransferase 1-like [Ctenocephalides felis]
MLSYKYLSEEHLKGFEKYKYNSKDTSIFSVHVMHPFWDRCVEYCPRWIAPNLLTFAGFLLTVLNFFCWYDYFFDSAIGIPPWVWLFVGVNLFVAYTLDGIDGKQARRTGTSGPLGELFDHGLDSWSSVLIPVFMYSMFGRQDFSAYRMYFVVWNVFVNFYLTHWEKYNTGVLFLPWGYDFTMVGATFVLLLTWAVGTWIWTIPLPLGLRPSLIFESVLYFSAMLSSQTVIAWNIYKSYKEGTGKMRPPLEAVRPLWPLILLFVSSAYWATYSRNQVADIDPRALYIMTGTVFSNICCRLIVAQMTDTRCDLWNWLLLPVIIASYICTVNPLSFAQERFVLYAITVLVTVAHIHYGVCVVRQMCEHFKRDCFRVPKKNQQIK